MGFLSTILGVIGQLAKSKTVVLAWLTFAIGLLGYVAGQDVIKENPAVVAFIVSVIGALQFLVRLFTSVPVGAKRGLFNSRRY